MTGPLVTFATMHSCGGCQRTKDSETRFWIFRGRLAGPRGKRYINLNAKSTVELADIPVCPWVSYSPEAIGDRLGDGKSPKPFNGLLELLEAQYATPDAPPVDWSL